MMPQKRKCRFIVLFEWSIIAFHPRGRKSKQTTRRKPALAVPRAILLLERSDDLEAAPQNHLALKLQRNAQFLGGHHPGQ